MHMSFDSRGANILSTLVSSNHRSNMPFSVSNNFSLLLWLYIQLVSSPITIVTFIRLLHQGFFGREDLVANRCCLKISTLADKNAVENSMLRLLIVYKYILVKSSCFKICCRWIRNSFACFQKSATENSFGVLTRERKYLQTILEVTIMSNKPINKSFERKLWHIFQGGLILIFSLSIFLYFLIFKKMTKHILDYFLKVWFMQ